MLADVVVWIIREWWPCLLHMKIEGDSKEPAHGLQILGNSSWCCGLLETIHLWVGWRLGNGLPVHANT